MSQEQEPQQVDPNAALEKAFEKLAAKLQPPQQQQQQMPQMSQEEMDQHFKTFRMSPQVLEAMFGEAATPETRMAAFQHIIQGVVANSVAMSNIMAQHHIAQFQSQYEPEFQDVRHLAEKSFFGELYEGHDGLKPHEPIIRELLPQLKSAPDYPKDKRAEQPSYVRQKMIDLMKKTNPDFDPTGGQGQPQPGNVTPFPQKSSASPHAAPNSLSGGQQNTGAAGGGKQSSGPIGANPAVGF